MDLNFTVSLTDIGLGLDISGGSESERQEILDFLVSVDESMADAEFTRNLLYRLVEDYSHDVEVRGWEPVALPEERATTFGQLYETLSHMDEDKLIALVANAMMVRRERERELEARLCRCGHERDRHKSKNPLLAPDSCSVVYCKCDQLSQKQEES